MPGEFMTYNPGQTFEAVVSRDPGDFHLLAVTHIRRIGSLPRMRKEEFEELLHAVPTTESLPDADWD